MRLPIAKARSKRPALRSRRSILWIVLALTACLGGVEAIRWVSFYQHANTAQDSLRVVERQLDLTSLMNSGEEVEGIRGRLTQAEADLKAAEGHVARDPLMAIARRVPGIREQAVGLTQLVRSARSSAATGIQASDVLLAYINRRDDPDRAALQEGVDFLQSQMGPMTNVRRSLEQTKQHRAGVPGGLRGPLDAAASDLDRALEKLDALVTGYERAMALLPDLLGFDGARTYLILAQNNTELFASGGLISNYGLVTFDDGRVSSMQFEYFGELFQRWQKDSGREYVEPPVALKQYLLRDVSWALGEAGWYPDFPSTAELANSFVQKGGVSAPDGTIAIDLQFVEALLRLFGPVPVDVDGIGVTADNLNEITLQQTRNETLLPDAVGKGFIAALAGKLVERIIATPKEKWASLIEVLDRMGRERHLQIHFTDPPLQALATEYGFDGGMIDQQGDFLLLTDTSVRSTKLNLILENSVDAEIQIEDTASEVVVAYTTINPFPEWQTGRDPQLVRALMLDGIYGSYLRLYAPPQAQLLDLRINSEPVGPEAIDIELEKRVFARFTPILPGETKTVEFHYRSDGVVEQLDGGWKRYRLYIQKQPGTRAIPLTMQLRLPPGADVRSVTVNGVEAELSIETDLLVDRTVEVIFRPAR